MVPQAPGGGNDAIARLIGARLTQTLKQQSSSTTAPGAGGLIAAEHVAKSPPDGYTLLLGNVATLAIIPNVQKNVPYDPFKDFEPVSLIASAPLLVTVHPSLPVTSVKQLIALAKAKPGAAQLRVERLRKLDAPRDRAVQGNDRQNLTHVPYKGPGPAMTDLLGGQVQVCSQRGGDAAARESRDDCARSR